jgi:hypothetical protein
MHGLLQSGATVHLGMRQFPKGNVVNVTVTYNASSKSCSVLIEFGQMQCRCPLLTREELNTWIGSEHVYTHYIGPDEYGGDMRKYDQHLNITHY